MSVSFHPDDDVIVDVADPGYGYLEIDLDESNHVLISGYHIGRVLRSLTHAATSPGEASRLIDIYELGEIPIAAARVLLPAVQQAAIYAAAGTERADRLLDEPNPEEPLPPLCARCAEGQVAGERNRDPHPGCEHDGHAPFGHKNSSGAWQRAKTSYAEHRAEVDQLLRLPRKHRQ